MKIQNNLRLAPRAFAFLCALFAIAAFPAVHAQVIFADTFEIGSNASLNGQKTSDDNATWSVTNSNAVFQRTNSYAPLASVLGDKYAQAYANSGGSTWATLSTDFDDVSAYTFNIGFLSLNSTGTFGIFVSSNSATLTSGFTFTVSNSTSIAVAYVNASGISTSLGTVAGTLTGRAGSESYLSNISVTVTGNSQQLSINGVSYGSVIATQGTSNDGTADQIRLYAAGGAAAIDARIDNLTATAIPEPAATVAALGAGALAALAFCRRHRFLRRPLP